MQSNEIIKQLSLFASNLAQVTDVLHSLAGSNEQSTRSTLEQMNEAKSSLLDTLILLNATLVAQASLIQVPIVYPGSLVLAPRLFRGSLCWDFAIVTNITENRRPALTTTSTAQMLDKFVLRNSEPDSEVEVVISVLWLRPQTLYEHFSHTIAFTPAQLQQPRSAVQYWQKQEAALSIVQGGDDLLFLNTDYSSAQAGVWLPAKVASVQPSTATGATVTIVPNTTHNTGVSNSNALVLPMSMSKVTLLPRSTADNAHTPSTTQHVTTSKTSSAHVSRLPRHSLYSDSESDSENELYVGITSLPSYADRHISKNASSASLSTLPGPAGVWETHTKGFGSKIMARMGYQRGSGKGLGKHSQGITAPIEGLAKALPAGLSLDFINELTSSSGVSVETALEQRKSDIKLDIVARFNAAQRTAAPKVKSKPHKASTASISKPLRVNNTFEFLNTMEINRANTTTMTVPRAPTVNAHNARNASAHRNPNMNKMF